MRAVRRGGIVIFALTLFWLGCSASADPEPGVPTAPMPPGDRVSARVKALFPEFFPEGVAHSIPLGEIEHGGPPKDGIPALTRPRTIPGDRADYLRGDDVVLGIKRNGLARAYPLRILNWHEIVNDELGGEPVLVTYCPLCGTGIAFDPHVDGKATEFGVSGLLHNSDLLMYDRDTNTPSLWQQALGSGVVGPKTGTRLEMIPALQTRWDEWRRANPNTTVLSTETGYRRNYDRDPYSGYGKSDALFFPVRGERDDLPRKTLVFGLILDGETRAYPLDALAGGNVVNDRLGTTNLVVVASDGSPPSVRIFARDEHQFNGNAVELTDENGARWTVTEEALVGPDGARLDRVGSGFVSFWFAWSAFYPQTDIFTGGSRVAPDESRPDRWGRIKKGAIETPKEDE